MKKGNVCGECNAFVYNAGFWIHNCVRNDAWVYFDDMVCEDFEKKIRVEVKDE